MKVFTIIKVGYTVGIYGCSGEYFHLMGWNDTDSISIRFHGMYGAEERVRQAMQDKGYTFTYFPNEFGRMTRKDHENRFMHEGKAIEEIELLTK